MAVRSFLRFPFSKWAELSNFPDLPVETLRLANVLEPRSRRRAKTAYASWIRGANRSERTAQKPALRGGSKPRCAIPLSIRF